MRKYVLLIAGILTAAYCLAQTNLSASEELLRRFQTISDKICWEMVRDYNQTAGEYGEELPEDQLKTMAEKASSDLMARYKNAFILSEAEAKELIAGKSNDLKNRQAINRSIREFAKLSLMLPMPIQYLIDQYGQGNLEGLELEFAVRLFKDYLQ